VSPTATSIFQTVPVMWASTSMNSSSRHRGTPTSDAAGSCQFRRRRACLR
jgi:hypothetical protein